MWTEAQIANDLRELGLREGMAVLAHTSLRAIGPMEERGVTLLKALRQVLSPEGTLLVPAFTPSARDPLEQAELPETAIEEESLRAAVPLFDPATTPVDTSMIGAFPEIVRQQPDAHRSSHPGLSFAAIGAAADFLTRDVPFHYPLGSNSPLARLHQLKGSVLLIGVDHTVNSSLHLAEVWADVPYIHRSATLKTGEETWTSMRGSPECSKGFGRIEPLLRQSRNLREGYIGNALSQLLSQPALVSMGVTLLQGERSFLLCDRPTCRACTLARKLNADTNPDLSSLFTEWQS